MATSVNSDWDAEARRIHEAGPAAIVALLVTIAQLSQRVQALEERLAQNSGNSSKPPSSDGFNKPAAKALKPMPQSLRKKTGKKPGAQKGHPGATLQPVEKPDQTVEHRPSTCAGCDGVLGENAAIVSVCSRQVFEIPEPRAIVTEHRMLTLQCPCCGKETKAAAPMGVDQPVQYGPNLLGFATYLHVAHLVPYKRCSQIVQDVTGTPFSAGSLHRALRTAHDRLADFDRRLQKALAAAPVKHVDETSVRVGKKLHWMHVRSNKSVCRIFHHEKRGGEALADLKDYAGTLVSDFFSGYTSLPCTHVYCGAHLLRELRFVNDVIGQSWAGNLFAVIESLLDACHRARDRGLAKVPRARSLARNVVYWARKGIEANPVNPASPGADSSGTGSSKARCLATRILERRADYLRFLTDLSLPFTNNEAEHDVRMPKLKQKISGCFRTDAGADIFCRIRSYTATCQKQRMNLLECLRLVYVGQPFLLSLRTA